MNTPCALRFARCGVAIGFVLHATHAGGQSQPATIPTAVAQAMSVGSQMFGPTRYFDGRTPSEWPTALVPSGARVIGGGVIGDSAMFRMQTAVFEFADASDPKVALRELVARAGYAARNLARPGRSGGGGGFIASGPPTDDMGYCKGGTFLMFGVVDSTQSSRVFAVSFIDGEAGQSNCSPRRDMMGSGPRVSVPPLLPPSGSKSFDGGSGWSGNGGNARMTLLTTLGVDSVLYHYTSQLVAGGWKAEGKPGLGGEAAVQAFSFRDGDELWAATLLITAMAEKREVMLTFRKRE